MSADFRPRLLRAFVTCRMRACTHRELGWGVRARTLRDMRLKLIACEILYREICAVVARSTNQGDVLFMPKGLHDSGQATMHARLGEALAQADETGYDALPSGHRLCA